MKDLQINSKGPTNISEIFWYYKEAHWLDIKIKKGENKGVKHKVCFAKHTLNPNQIGLEVFLGESDPARTEGLDPVGLARSLAQASDPAGHCWEEARVN